MRRLRGHQPARRPARLRPRHGRGRLLPRLRPAPAPHRPRGGPLVAGHARAGLAAAGRAGQGGRLMALRFGVLGTGYWALETHASMLAAADDAELVAIWGRDPAKTEAAAARFGIAGFSDLDRLLAEGDAGAIAVPPDVQAELATRAAAAGCHLLLDKPVALSLDGADRVAKAVEAAGVASLVFCTLRFLPALAAWVEQAAGAGDWQGGDGAWLGTVFTEPDSPFAGSPWRRAKGALWDLGPHVLSLALPVLGPVQQVTAATGHGDTVHLVLGHTGGVSSTLTMSQTVPVPAAHIGLQADELGPRRGEHLGVAVALAVADQQAPAGRLEAEVAGGRALAEGVQVVVGAIADRVGLCRLVGRLAGGQAAVVQVQVGPVREQQAPGGPRGAGEAEVGVPAEGGRHSPPAGRLQ